MQHGECAHITHEAEEQIILDTKTQNRVRTQRVCRHLREEKPNKHAKCLTTPTDTLSPKSTSTCGEKESKADKPKR